MLGECDDTFCDAQDMLSLNSQMSIDILIIGSEKEHTWILDSHASC